MTWSSDPVVILSFWGAAVLIAAGIGVWWACK